MDKYYVRLSTLLKNDPLRMDILRAVSTLSLPDCWVAAGFVRNVVWDDLHNKNAHNRSAHNKRTPLNDVDVIYYSPGDIQSQLAANATIQLQALLPEVNWQVKNQALMHIKRLHNQYASSGDAMTFWPEQETAIGVSLKENNGNSSFSFVAPFGISSVFEGHITYNPKADEQAFWQRIKTKNWLTIWPDLVIRNVVEQRE